MSIAPTPWASTPTVSRQGTRVRDSKNRNVALAIDDANAAHIVKCVNERDELVAALELALNPNSTDGERGLSGSVLARIKS